MIDVFDGFFKGKEVLVTGHTGFKGSWLCIWLHELGAEVVGVGLDPYSERDNFVLSGIGSKIKADIRADIRDGEKMKQIFAEYQPEIVFHLAAQPLVRLSYEILEIRQVLQVSHCFPPLLYPCQPRVILPMAASSGAACC